MHGFHHLLGCRWRALALGKRGRAATDAGGPRLDRCLSKKAVQGNAPIDVTGVSLLADAQGCGGWTVSRNTRIRTVNKPVERASGPADARTSRPSPTEIATKVWLLAAPGLP
jgi:hypothetical protein